MPSQFLSIPRAFALLFGVLATGTLAMQVVMADSQATPTETALFSVLQFVFSIAFAWMITGMSAKRAFAESQKAFAIAAYRRINEIDEGVERLIARAHHQMRAATPELRHELEVVIAIATGVRSSIKSSVADWGDVIGEEISTINRIERIQDQQDQLTESPVQDTPVEAPHAETRELHEQLERNNEQIAQLLASLPPALRVVAEKPKRARDPVEVRKDRLRQEAATTNTVRLRGFWDETLQRDIRSMNVGDRLTIRIGTVGDRTLAVCAHDETGNAVGIIVNNGPGPYYVFREALVDYFESTSIPVTIASIDSRDAGTRHYFDVVVTPEAFAGRLARIEARKVEAQALPSNER